VDTIADIDIPLLSASSIEELLSFSKEIDEDNGFILVDLGTENLELLEVLNENNQALVITILAPNAGCMALLPEAFDKTHCYILNAVEPRYDFQRAAAQFVQDMAEDNLIGTIRRDEALNEALGKLERLNIYAPASAALNDFDSIAQQILLMLGRQTMVKPKASAHVS
ncbi:MAG: cellulose synthase operon protein YhjQ/BcsQ, partial [Zymomonas mobilis subsp. pomaceae]